MSHQTKDFKFHMKAANDSGAFEGMAAVYGNVDLGGDVIEPGAFTRTLKNSGGKVPILWQHDTMEPIGMGTLQDSKQGLMITGQLVMASPVAQKALALMQAEVLRGLSIGYSAVKSEYDKAKDVRNLQEVKLYEVSLVTFPMNPKALVSSVKAMDELGALLETYMLEIKRGGTLSPETKSELTHLHEKISALIASESGNDGSLAKHELSDSDLHSLMTSMKESIQ